MSVAGLALLAGWLATGDAVAQVQNGITSPQEGDRVAGIILVEGTATDPAFLRYEIAVNRGGDWIVFADGSRQVQQGTLAVWDTTVGHPGASVFPDGPYQLRLRVVRQDYNYDEYYVRNILVANSEATPTATATGPAVVTPQLATATPPAAETSMTAVPDLLPSLTPFPTPTVPPTPEGVLVGGMAATPDASSGLAQRLEALDTGRFRRAFWVGARIVFYAFAAFAIYLVSRALIRRLWRDLISRSGKPR